MVSGLTGCFAGLLKRSAATKPKLSLQRRQEKIDFAAQESHRGLKSATATSLLSKRSTTTKRTAKNQKAVELAFHQQRRSLQEDSEIDAASLAICELFLEALLGPDSGCSCIDEESSPECDAFGDDYISANCVLCDTIQSEEACVVVDEGATLAATPDMGSVFADCLTYSSGPFADDTLCAIENFVDNTCAITINETECTSCSVVLCNGFTDYDIDCSNIIAGETWNLCTDDIPESSPFIVFGSTDLFQVYTCDDDGGGADFGLDSLALELCQTFVDEQFGLDAGCVCEFDGIEFQPVCDCVFKACDTIQGEMTCFLIDEDAQFEAQASGVDGIANCLSYESDPFTDIGAICLIENVFDDTCAITINGEGCSSCTVVDCGDLSTDFQFDCSNLIAGETWSLCTDAIPEYSPFIAISRYNDMFSDFTCVSVDVDDPTDGSSNPGDGSLEDMSGGVTASSHVLGSIVGIIVVASFW